MENGAPSPAALKRARNTYFGFAFFNVLSFQLISGNIITLYALRLGAGNSMVGLISSFLYMSLLFLLVGRLLVPRFGIVKLMGIFFVIRYTLFIPMPLAALFASPQTIGLAFAMMLIASAGFNFARGIAIVSDSPLVASLSGTRDRGFFLSKVQIIVQSMAIAGALFTSFILGEDSPTSRFVVLISIGILAGYVGSGIIFKLPEPREGLPENGGTMLESVKLAFSLDNVRRFFLNSFMVHASIALFGAFLVVYFKDRYLLADHSLILVSVLANVGALFMAVLSGLALDRIGSKPLLFAFSFVSLVSIIVAVVSPPLSGPPLFVYAGVITLLWGMGSSGMGNSGLNYFLGITDASRRLDFGIIYYFVMGAAGTIGSIAGGLILDLLLYSLKLDPILAYRLFFTLVALMLVAILFNVRSLANAGAYPIRDAIMFILSPRDMRALTLLRRLDNAETVNEESAVLEELRVAPSELALGGMIDRLRSPSFQIRAKALEYFVEAPLDNDARRLLVSEVRNNPFTTGNMAARIIGDRDVREGVEALRSGLQSQDTLLAGECMVALAKLGDIESISAVEGLFNRTHNPRLTIFGAKALELFQRPSSVRTLLGKLESRHAPYIRDEIILSLSGCFGYSDWFYPRYVDFLEKAGMGVALLLDDIEAGAKAGKHLSVEPLGKLARSITAGGNEYSGHVGFLLQRTELLLHGENVTPIVGAASRNKRLLQLPRFRFFLAATVIRNALDDSQEA